MTDYTELIKALRCCADDDVSCCEDCPNEKLCIIDCYDTMMHMMAKAADAIEEQQAELQRMVEAEINECNRRIATAQVNAKLAKNYWSPPKEETE